MGKRELITSEVEGILIYEQWLVPVNERIIDVALDVTNGDVKLLLEYHQPNDSVYCDEVIKSDWVLLPHNISEKIKSKVKIS